MKKKIKINGPAFVIALFVDLSVCDTYEAEHLFGTFNIWHNKNSWKRFAYPFLEYDEFILEQFSTG